MKATDTHAHVYRIFNNLTRSRQIVNTARSYIVTPRMETSSGTVSTPCFSFLSKDEILFFRLI